MTAIERKQTGIKGRQTLLAVIAVEALVKDFPFYSIQMQRSVAECKSPSHYLGQIPFG